MLFHFLVKEKWGLFKNVSDYSTAAFTNPTNIGFGFKG